MTPDEAARVLGVARDAPEDEIRSAYRRLARENHPDRNPDDPAAEARFRSAAEAHQVLTQTPREAPSPPPEAAPSEIFDKVFGRGRHRRVRGADLRYTLRISLPEALRGGPQQVRVPAKVSCRRCGGTGAEPGTAPLLCPQCGGTGVVSRKRGFFDAKETCPKCRGRGRLFPKPCQVCHGEGREEVERRIDVVVPAGVSDGTRLRVAGKGQAGEGEGEAGDLFVVIAIEPHPFFTRDGRDVVVEVPVSFATAALGGSVRIP
ncbi:MAG: DnaJ C-terminal domain-containing protein, partial [Myxococcota bacterium]